MATIARAMEIIAIAIYHPLLRPLLRIVIPVEVQRLRLLHQVVQLLDYSASSNNPQGKGEWGNPIPLTLN